MEPVPVFQELPALGTEESGDRVMFSFQLSRRCFVQALGTGLAIVCTAGVANAQNRGGRNGAQTIAARLLIGQDGAITVFTGKIEMGQGSRAELAQAAAEELRVQPSQITLVMGDTSQVPDDGLSAGSRTTPATMPAVRQAAAAARQLLADLAAKRWNVEPGSVEVRDGKVAHPPTQRTITYTELAKGEGLRESFKQPVPAEVELTPVSQWQAMGKSFPRPNRRDLVTGAHLFPSDHTRPGMLYGKILRAPTLAAKLVSADLSPAKAMAGVVAVQDGTFVGVAAPNTFLAEQAIKAIAATAKWETSSHPSSAEVYEYLREAAEGEPPKNPFLEELNQSARKLSATYHVAYVQHAPMETRTALAEWSDGKLTVWTGTQNPFGYHNELARTFRLPSEHVRVLNPDFGGGFGGKHTSEAAIEAARLAQAAGKPVLVRWTREEEYTWAYFRPAGVIDTEASLDAQGRLTSWHFININAGGAAIDTLYRTGKSRCRSVGSKAPLRQGSYRALAANANNFARESFMDELAHSAGTDPLDFRLAHLEHPRLRAVLEEAAKRFSWRERWKAKRPGTGVGLACGTEKGSYVATCTEIVLDEAGKGFSVRHIGEVFECGAVVNPDNLIAQVQGCVIMALGPALREEMRFADGRMQNASFGTYLVPRLTDVPELDIHILPRPDLASVGAGETPMIAVAPAIANALFHASGRRVRQMPIRLQPA
jgi:isoquinoline 1-oxidoreductase